MSEIKLTSEAQAVVSKDDMRVCDGAEAALKTLRREFPDDPKFAVASLLFAAACLARGCDMEREHFYMGVEMSWNNAHYVEKPSGGSA